jgi:hypothetical protein
VPRTCTVCVHDGRAAIDAALVAGTALRDIARHHAVSKDALFRHRSDHIPAQLAKAQDAAEVAQADDLLREVRALRGKAYSLLLKAEAAGDIRTALAGIREARGCLELLAKLLGELDERPTVNILIHPGFQQAQTVILQALEPHPVARVAVADALAALGEGS